MAVLTYNGISFPYEHTTEYEMSSEYDESNTDFNYTKVSIKVDAVINPAYVTGVQGATAAAMMNAMQQKLLTPREALSLKVNGTDIIPIHSLNVDAKNGPFPQYCRITQLTSATFLIQYAIVARYCVGAKSSLVDNRWEESVDIDNLGLVTFTRTGKFTIHSDDAVALGVGADSLRPLYAIVAQRPGFLRKSCNFSISRDMLSVTYRITDEEQYKMPPQGFGIQAYTASGKLKIKATRGMSPVSDITCNCTLTAAKTQSQSALLKLCTALVLAKLNSQNPITTKNVVGNVTNVPFLLLAFDFEVEMWKNSVTCNAAARANFKVSPGQYSQRFGSEVALINGKQNTTSYTYVPFVDTLNKNGQGPTQDSPKIPDYGTGQLRLQPAPYFDPTNPPPAAAGAGVAGGKLGANAGGRFIQNLVNNLAAAAQAVANQ